MITTSAANIQTVFSIKTAFVEICKKLDNKSLNVFLRTCKAFEAWHKHVIKTNQVFQQLVLQNLKIHDPFSGYSLTQTLAFKKVISTNLVWQRTTSPFEKHFNTPLGSRIKGDQSLRSHPKYFKVYEGEKDVYFTASKLLLETEALTQTYLPILHYSLDAEKKPLQHLGALQFDDAYFCRSMCTIYNDCVGITLMQLDNSCLMFWNLKTHEKLQTVEFTAKELDPLWINSKGNTLFLFDRNTKQHYSVELYSIQHVRYLLDA